MIKPRQSLKTDFTHIYVHFQDSNSFTVYREAGDLKYIFVSVESEIKSCDVECFLDEVTNMISLDHPNILCLLGVSSHEGKLCMIYPLMKNKDLRQYLLQKRTASFICRIVKHFISMQE